MSIAMSNDQTTNELVHRDWAWRIAGTYPVLVCAAFLSIAQPPLPRYFTASSVILITLLLTISVTDILWKKIPNWATYTGVWWAVMINAYASISSEAVYSVLGAVGISDSLLGAVLMFLGMLLIFSVTGGGAGDVKLTAAIGAFLGLSMAVDAILFSFVFAGGYAIIRAIWTKGPFKLLSVIGRSIGSFVLPLWVAPASAEDRAFMRQPMPLGPSFAAGTILVLFDVQISNFVPI